MPKAIIYARVSSREQEKEGFSIPAQLKLLNEYAQKHGIVVLQEFTDNETAKKSGRSNFNAMLEFFRKNKEVKIILVEKTDRLYRNFKDYIAIDDLMQDKDLEIHLVKEGSLLGKNSKSHDKFIHGIKVLIAKNYIDNLSEEIQKGLQEKAEQGYWPIKSPYGYKRVTNKEIVIDENKLPFVLRAFELYAEGNKSLEAVCKQLYNEGFLYQPTKPKIEKGTLEKLLKNPFYKGTFIYKGKTYEGNHKPIISSALFNKVQVAFKKDNKPAYNSKKFMFSNLITCGECGCSVVAEIKKQKYIYYHCTWGKGNCAQKQYIREEALEKQFESIVERVTISDEHKKGLIIALKDSHKDQKIFHQNKINIYRTNLDKIDNKLHKLYDDRVEGKIPEELWQKEQEICIQEKERTKTMIEAFEKSDKNYMAKGIQILELSNKAYDLYMKQVSEKKANVLKKLLSNCTLKDGKLSYDYKKPFDIIAEGIVCQFKWR